MKMMLTLMALVCLPCLLTGCSDDSDPVTTTTLPIDTAPPAVPAGLSCCGLDGYVKLAWDANVLDTDLAGYNVYRSVYGQTWALNVEPLQENRFIDVVPAQPEALYMVSAVDLSGNESAVALIALRCEEPEEIYHRQ